MNFRWIERFNKARETMTSFGIETCVGSDMVSIYNATDNEVNGQVKLWQNFESVEAYEAYAKALEDVKSGDINSMQESEE